MSAPTPGDSPTLDDDQSPQTNHAAGSPDEASAAEDDAAGRATHILTAPLGRAVLRFGVPLVVAMALQATFNLVDMFIVSKLPNGTEALAALAICDLVAMLATIAGNGVANASVAIIARRDGEGDKAGVSRATAQSISLTIVLSAVFGVIGIFGASFVTGDIMGAKGEVQDLSVAYMQVIVGGSFSILLLLQLVAILRAVGDSRTPMILLIGSNVANLFLTVLMVYGPGEAPDIFSWGPPVAEALGIERSGVVGAATSTVISRSAAILLGMLVLVRHGRGLRFPFRDLLPKLADYRALIRIAWPNSAQFLLRIGVILFFLGILSHKFTTAEDSSVVAAFGICVRLETVALFTGMGWGAAASTFVGQNLGFERPDRAYKAGWIAAAYNAVVMVGVLGLFFAYAPDIVAFWDDSPKVVDAGQEYLRIVGGSYAFLGAAVVISQALSGAGATLSAFVIDVVILLGLLIPITVLFLLLVDMTRLQVWLLVAAGNLVSAVAYGFWWHKRAWTQKVV